MSTATLTDPSTGSGTSKWFWRYWLGSSVSDLGDAVTLVALPLTAVMVAHATSFEVGILSACQLVGWLVIGLPAGAIVERFPLRGTQVALDVLRGLLLCSIPVVWWVTGRVTVVQLIAVALANSFAGVIFDVGNSTMLPFLVSDEELTARNSLTSGTQAVTQLAGPSVGGVLVQAVGAAGALIADVASYFVSAFVISSVPRPPKLELGTLQRLRVGEAIRAGWSFVVKHPILRPAMLDASAGNFVSGALTTLTPIFLVRTLDLHAAVIGVLYAAEGIGALIGASLTPKLSKRIGTARIALAADLVLPACVALLPLSTGGLGTLVFALGTATVGGVTVVSSIVYRTYRQIETPRELLPRVMATVRFVSWGVYPVGALAAGAAATWLGPRTALWWTAAASVIPALILLTSPIRRIRDLSDCRRSAQG